MLYRTPHVAFSFSSIFVFAASLILFIHPSTAAASGAPQVAPTLLTELGSPYGSGQVPGGVQYTGSQMNPVLRADATDAQLIAYVAGFFDEFSTFGPAPRGFVPLGLDVPAHRLKKSIRIVGASYSDWNTYSSAARMQVVFESPSGNFIELVSAAQSVKASPGRLSAQIAFPRFQPSGIGSFLTMLCTPALNFSPPEPTPDEYCAHQLSHVMPTIKGGWNLGLDEVVLPSKHTNAWGPNERIRIVVRNSGNKVSPSSKMLIYIDGEPANGFFVRDRFNNKVPFPQLVGGVRGKARENFFASWSPAEGMHTLVACVQAPGDPASWDNCMHARFYVPRPYNYFE